MSDNSDYNAEQLYKKGKKLYWRDEFDLALETFMDAIDQYHHPNSYYYVGIMHRKGKGTVKNYAKALKYYIKAVQKGVTAAVLPIAHIFYHGGFGVRRDYRKAMKVYLFADSIASEFSDTDISKTHYYIGMMHFYGYSTHTDYNSALMCLESSANNGHIDASCGVAQSYLSCNDLRQQLKLGFEWLLKAAKGGHTKAQESMVYFYQMYNNPRDYKELLYWLKQFADAPDKKTEYYRSCFEMQYMIGIIYKRGLDVPVDLNLALHWIKKSAAGGFKSGILEIGLMCYFDGVFGPKQEVAGLKWLIELAIEGHAYAQTELGNRLCQDSSVFCNYELAMHLFKRAEKCNCDSIAQYGIGNMYKQGWGVVIDYDIAFKWFKKAAKQKNSKAQHALGIMYAEGKSVLQNWKKAVFWYNTSVNTDDNPEAQYDLSQCYYKGQGVTENTCLGLQLLKRSAEQGNSNAQDRLRVMYDKGEFTETNSREALELLLKPAANDVSSDSLYTIGKMFHSGSIVRKNFVLAFEYYTRSAEKGNKDATEELKRLQLDESIDSVDKGPDDIDFILSSLKIIFNHDTAAQRKINSAIYFHVENTRSTILLETDESPKFFHVENTETTVINNNDEGPHFFHVENTKPAIVKTRARASRFSRITKYGIHRDFQKSLYWFKQAAVVDNRDINEHIKCYKAHYLIGLVYKHGLGVPVDLKLALRWFESSSNGNYGIGRLEKGLMNYFSGEFGPKREEKGLRWLKKLAKNNSAYAQAELGIRLCRDRSAYRNYEEAMTWLKEAVNYNGNTIAQWGIGNMYKHGWGVEINYATAIEWYKKAADCDESRAQHALGKMYAEGKGVTQDWEKAVFWYKKAVENDGNPEAQYDLLQCYYRGQGVRKNTRLSLELITLLAEQGNGDAIEELKRLEPGENSGKRTFSVNKNADQSDYMLSSLKISNQDDDAKFFHVEDNSNDTMSETEEENPKFFNVDDTSPKFFHVEDNSNDTMSETEEEDQKFINVDDTPSKFFHVEYTPNKFFHVKDTSSY
ncbi:hypothetical protein INT47_010851 [Mucor saturninus]|uniref:HCP-like protein n=1 Tax=Mucor saturninus TaxID=64648 RepID=A0A8H7V4H9_9FUNG|nr:hypothetical protein INT47_010851 [Mucor saturninus]